MPKLTDVLKKNQEMLKVAQQLGFSDIRLCVSNTQGFLGIYGIFDKQQEYKVDWNARCMALSYILGEITHCNVRVICDKDDEQGSVRKTKTLGFDEASTDTFEKIFSRPLHEYMLDEIGPKDDLGYQIRFAQTKSLYDELNSSTAVDKKFRK